MWFPKLYNLTIKYAKYIYTADVETRMTDLVDYAAAEKKKRKKSLSNYNYLGASVHIFCIFFPKLSIFISILLSG